ncbi:MAG TPA: hypothetical protein PKA64_09090 [Myxococcota bacterium]|nr:hypothetical protein [Myxococcota bacterium]
MRTSLLALALAATPALAFVPPETNHLGHEPVRLRLPDAQVQDLMARSPAWQAFVQGEGAGWTARFDTRTLVPARMMGPGLAIGPTGTQAEVEQAVLTFARRHADLLGAGRGTLAIRAAVHRADTDAWYVDVDTLIEGLPVWRGGLTFRLSHGLLVMVGADTYAHAPVTGAPLLSRADAMRAAVAQGFAPLSEHTRPAARLELLPLETAGKLELRVVWHTSSRTETPVGHWESFVDAATGALLASYNDVHFAQLLGEHDVRIGDGTLMTSALPYAHILSETEDTYTDAAGAYALGSPGPYTVELSGLRVKLHDEEGKVSPAVAGGDADTLTAADFADRQAPLTTYVYLHLAQDRGRALDPENPWPDTKVDAYVNIDDVCNAYFDGDVNFFKSGAGCNNTGQLADVIYHEWGHGFHSYAIVSGYYDGSLGEGAADTFAWMITDDPRIAPNFYADGGGELRNADNRTRYPEDYIANDLWIHFNGLIYSGSMWDTREALRASVGEPEATQILGEIWARMLRAGPDLTTAYEEAVFADDDNADLGDGTPHLCEIVDGFGAHGLGPAGGQDVRAEHAVVIDAPAGEPVPVAVTVHNPAPSCFDLSPTGGVIHWRVNRGDWQTSPMAPDAEEVAGSIPAGELGDLVEYWLEVQTANGGRVFEPTGGPIRPHTYYVGDVLEVSCQDFEEDNGGYHHVLLSGEEGEGADDWQWGKPRGVGGDPDAAASGNKVWGTDLGGDDFNGQYQNEKQTRLISPEIDTLHYEGVFLRYQRWLTIEDGVYDQARIRADGQAVWTNFESDVDNGVQHHLDDRWETHVVKLAGQADDGKVELAWDLQSDQGLAFGGWTLDDVCLYAPATPDNRLGVHDLVVTGDRRADVTLTWTQPLHAPVTEVVVVKKVGGPPTSHTDGKVVFSTKDVAVGAAASAQDHAGPGEVWYAVYASDGEHWLSWTREGFNAAAVDLDADGEPDAGCGCATGGASWSWVGALGLLAATRRRRVS